MVLIYHPAMVRCLYYITLQWPSYTAVVLIYHPAVVVVYQRVVVLIAYMLLCITQQWSSCITLQQRWSSSSITALQWCGPRSIPHPAVVLLHHLPVVLFCHPPVVLLYHPAVVIVVKTPTTTCCCTHLDHLVVGRVIIVFQSAETTTQSASRGEPID